MRCGTEWRDSTWQEGHLREKQQRMEEWLLLGEVRSLGSILLTDIIISDIWGDMSLMWVKHGEWVVANETTDCHMIERAMTHLPPRAQEDR